MNQQPTITNPEDGDNNDIQKRYILKYYQEPHNRIQHRKVKAIVQTHLKNAKIYIALIALAVVGFLLNRELNVVAKLSPLLRQVLLPLSLDMLSWKGLERI